ncbi:MAG: sigma-70 family RNA polymerase sigma factor [Chloroflexi bacterium]|nr:MAG: sigma-70 family RNA polymerase sigma factor [Chloroflexota bacterium]
MIKTCQVMIRARQAGPQVCLDDILYMVGYGSQLEFVKRGAGQIMSAYDEHRALDGLRRLDSQAVGAIYDQYFSEVYRYVRYRISDDTIAEDIASDVFVRLLEAAQKKQAPQSSLKGWLIATASHAVNDHLRRQYRRPVEALSESMPDHGPSVHSEVVVREQNRMVQGAYAQLTSEQQHVLALRFGQGYSIEETAAHLKKNINAVKALQFRALASLQRQIGEVNYE